MPVPLVTQHYPDDFQTETVQFTTPIDGQAFFYADRDIVIDSLVVGVAVAGGISSAIKFTKTTSGTAANPADPTVANITGGTDITETVMIDAVATASAPLLSTSTDVNIVKAGNWVGVERVSGTFGTPNLIFRVRFRSRVA
jgi:hypothetical protein